MRARACTRACARARACAYARARARARVSASVCAHARARARTLGNSVPGRVSLCRVRDVRVLLQRLANPQVSLLQLKTRLHIRPISAYFDERSVGYSFVPPGHLCVFDRKLAGNDSC